MIYDPIAAIHRFEEPLVYNNVRKFIHQINGVLINPIDGLNIVTTKQSKTVEFYGWSSPVKPHVDGSGIIFFCPIYKEYADEVLCVDGMYVPLDIGTVYMLDDSYEHATFGKGHVIAMFKGAYTKDELTPELFTEICKDFKIAAFDPQYNSK